MKIYKVPHDNGYYRIMVTPDVEFANPIDYFSSFFYGFASSVEKDILLSSNLDIPDVEIEQFVLKRASEKWENEYRKITQTEIPVNLLLLLESRSKKEQIRLLKNQYITPSILIAFICKAWTDNAYSFSQYTAHHHHKGIDKKDLPQLIEIKDDIVIKIGSTSLSNGQLKNVVNQRKVTISKILDRDNYWHCFFTTFNSLNRKEQWKGGQPHFHYISSSFGLSREEVLKSLQDEYYKLNNLPHIELRDYR